MTRYRLWKAHLLLVRGTSLFAGLVKHVTKSEYSHCAFGIYHRTYEADIGGVISRDLHSYAWDYDLFEIEGMDDHRTHLLHQWCIEQHRKKVRYGYGKVLGIGAEMLFQWTGWRAIADHNAMYCAEYVCSGLTAVGIELQHPGPVLTPGHISHDPMVRKVGSYEGVTGRQLWVPGMRAECPKKAAESSPSGPQGSRSWGQRSWAPSRRSRSTWPARGRSYTGARDVTGGQSSSDIIRTRNNLVVL